MPSPHHQRPTPTTTSTPNPPTVPSRSKFASPRHMFDQLGTSEDKVRRFPSSAPTNPPTQLPCTLHYPSAQPKERPCTLRYDATAPPHRASGFGRTSSTPEGRHGEPPVLFSRLSSAPAWFPSPHEEVKVMQQSSREAWTIFGSRFHAAHASRNSHTRELARRSSAPDAPSRVPSRAREPSRRSSVASHPPAASGARTAASPDIIFGCSPHERRVDAPSRPLDAPWRSSTSDASSRTLEPAGSRLSISHHRSVATPAPGSPRRTQASSVAPGAGAPQRERPSRPRS